MAERKRDENGRFVAGGKARAGVAKAEPKPKPAPVVTYRRIRGRIVRVVQDGEA